MKMELALMATKWIKCCVLNLKRALFCLWLVSCTCICTCTSPGGANTLYLVSLLPYPDTRPTLQPSWEEGPALMPAAELAVELINNRSDILSDYNIEMIAGDSGCDVTTKAVTAFVETVMHSSKQVAGIVGPGCSASALVISSLNGREQLSLINVHIAGSLNLSNRTKYPNSFGTLDSTEVFVRASLALMKENNWTQVAAFYDESRLYYYSTLLAFQDEVNAINANSNKNDSVIDMLILAVYSNYIPFGELQEAKRRIAFLLVGPDLLGKIVCLAYHDKLVYPTYQWITVSRTLEEMTAEVNFTYAGKHYFCSREEMYASGNGSLIMHYRLNHYNENMFTDSGLTYQEFVQEYNQRVIVHNKDQKNDSMVAPSFWATLYFDAVHWH